MSIVEPYEPDERKRQAQIDMARKAILIVERNKRKNANGYLAAEAAEEARIAAGLEPRPTNQQEN